MTGTELRWVGGPWPGKLAVAPRPRGGEWLKDEILSWKKLGIDTVLSLLTPDEEGEFELLDERETVTTNGMNFLALPVPDRQVPTSLTEVATALERLNARLSHGKNVVIHCRQGIGRSGMIAACLLITMGLDAGAAVEKVSAARGVRVPETSEQRQWIDHYAATLATSK